MIKYGSDLIYFLSWHDALERLDTLILEIRHLQTSILSQLREPVFYHLLHYEEEYLWGTNWFDSDKIDIKGSSLDKLTISWMLDYPAVADIGRSKTGSADLTEEGEKIYGELIKRLGEIWISSTWNRDQKRHYHVLWGLQQLKRKIFKDKLFLCRFALNLKIYQRSPETSSEQNNKAKLLIVRAGVLRNLAQYILLLRNFQNAFNKSMDTGVQDHLRPSIERRRELGIYMDYLSERSKDILRDMTLLLSDMGTKKKYSTTEIVYHRWRHHYTSTNQLLNIDYISKHSDNGYVPSSIRFVNTSYYMPERPDLQPVIAHEVAHALIKDHLDNLDGVSLAAADIDDKFSDLIARIQSTLSNFHRWDRLPKADMSVIELSREIVCDLLAASVKGYSYVYALFLEVAGMDTERLLVGRSSDNIIDLSNVDEIQSGPPIAALSRDWLLRIKITTYWLQKCHHLPTGNLGSLLLDGIDQALDDLNAYLDSLIVHADPSRGLMWGVLIRRLCEVIEDCDAIESAKAWRRKRSEDDIAYPKSQKAETDKERGPRKLPRSMARLHKDVRDKLFYMQLNAKSREKRPLSKIDDNEIKNKFEQYYGIVSLDDRYAHYDREKEANTLFRHLYDIPWQAALMRAMDIVGSKNINFSSNLQNPKEIIEQLHNSFPLGRAFFSYALEFYSWSVEPATHRLRTAVDIVDKIVLKPDKSNVADQDIFREKKRELKACIVAKIISKFDPSTVTDRDNVKRKEEIEEELRRWLGKKNYIPDREIWLGSRTRTRDQLLSAMKNQPEDYSAYAILHAYQNISSIDSEICRSCERIAGLKLDALHGLLEELHDLLEKLHKPLDNDEEKDSYCEFIIFLSIRSSKTKFINTMTSSLSNCMPGDKKGGKLNTAVLGRIASYGLYPTYPDESLHAEIRDRSQHTGNNIWHVLGRYDAIIIKETRPIYRYPLQYFFRRDKPKNDICFPPFFARQEMALFGRFIPSLKEDDKKNKKPSQSNIQQEDSSIKNFYDKNKPVAFFVITLQKRQYRLDFIYLLIEAKGNPKYHPLPLSQVIKNTLNEDTDAYFLTDGWGDIVIVFSNPKDARDLDTERLENIFEFQKVISQNFMVDRTDLILTPLAFDCALTDNVKSQRLKWSLFLQIRLIEDRVTNKAKDEFINYFYQQQDIEDSCKSILKFVNLRLLSAPGKDDFIIEVALKKNITLDESENNWFKCIRKFIHPIYLNRVDTIVAKYTDNPSSRNSSVT